MKYMCEDGGGNQAEIDADDVGEAAINFCEDHVDIGITGADCIEEIMLNHSIEVTDEEGDTTTVQVNVDVQLTFTANT